MKTTLRLTIAAFVLAAFNLSAATLYVSLESTNPVPPYTNWATAANVIQDAVDAATDGDTVLVTNGVYEIGERDASVLDTNQQPPQLVSVHPSRVVVTNAIRLESVNGPLPTIIEGGQFTNQLGEVTNRIRCVFLGPNAVLSGFTLTKGCQMGRHYLWGGGGVRSDRLGIVTNCVLTANIAHHGGGACGGTLYNCTLTDNETTQTPWGEHGGGASDSTLYNCTLTGNYGGSSGGGASWSTLYNCTLTNNWAGSGGGIDSCTLYNCLVMGNSAWSGGGGARDSTLFNCTVTGNSAGYGGGVSGGTSYNCIIYYNTAPEGGANFFMGFDIGTWVDVPALLHDCCTTPLPTNGIGNIAGPPLFVDMTACDFRLWEGSPCIDAGTILLGVSGTATNYLGSVSVFAYAHDPTDILGNTRFIDGNGDGIVAWDIGAYEFNSFKPPRFIGSPQRTADHWSLNITGAANKWVYVQRSSNLRDWEDLWPPVFMEAEGVQQITDTEPGQTLRFYRGFVPQ